MTKLLTDLDFAEIRSAVNDVAETFLQKEILYRLFQDSMSRMNSDLNKNATYADFLLHGLVIWDEKQAIETRVGIADNTGGYVLFGIDALKTAVQIITIPVPEPHQAWEEPPVSIPQPDPETLATLFDSNNRLLMNEGTDRMEFDGVEMLIDSVVQLGQIKDENAVVKVFFHKQISNI